MCGIGGIVRTDGGSVRPSDLATLIHALSHRGPDGEKSWISPDGSCGLVHLRLAILDTDSRSDEPMHSADGSATIVFNGEIYNFLELREELQRGGARFRTEGDAEVLLEGWRVWGEDMLPRLNGMWAFAIRDNRSGEVFFARDRFGIKPLLYSIATGHLAFASEMRALTALPFVSHDLDTAVTARMLFEPMGVEASEATIHKDVRRLPPGHCARFANGALRLRRWWRTTDHLVTPPSTLDEAAERFRELFLDSVRLRMRSDVRIGSCLSGGFDSSAVVSSMAYVAGAHGDHRRESDDWRHAFVASYPGHPQDETAQARITAAHACVTAHIEDFGRDEGPAQADAVLADLDDIYISLPTAAWKIYRSVRNLGIRVSLDGHGADELMGAYFAPGTNLTYLARSLLRNHGGGSEIGGFVSDQAKLLALRLGGEYFLRQHKWSAPPPLPIAPLRDELPSEWGRLNRRLYGMFHSTILPTILRNFDRLSMAHGIEIRMPFMDWRLVTFVMSLPDHMKAGAGVTKLVAREALQGIMPEEIRTSSRKLGFNPPMPAWMNGSLGQWAVNILCDCRNSEFDAVVDTERLIVKVRELNSRQAWDWSNSGRLWPYVNLKWYLDSIAGQMVRPRGHISTRVAA
jgi:asparagine synthase (glutamine-hydrolysing)